MKLLLNALGFAMLLLVSACATSTEIASHDSSQTAVCLVCRYNNDLACVNLHVKETTPHLNYQGTTYYFCSEECKRSFAKNPSKYLSQ